MATFYKYQERDLDSQVNYADIGLGISNLVTDQLATRKAKKEAYDDQVRAFNQYLDEHPVGDDVNMTEFTANYSSQMQQQMLANQRAFKNGRISERDNVVFMQNVQNGTKTMFDLSTDYQAEYADKMERLKSTDPKNKSQLIETWLMENSEGYGNFKNAKPIIDPKTGLVLMSVKQKDGTYQTSSAADLQTRIKAKYDYFDTDAAATEVENGIGQEITSALIAANRSKGGKITSVEDKELKDGFKDALVLQLESYLESDLATSSILTNTLNKKYTPTFSREEAAKDPTKILMVTTPGGNGTPMPDFSTENGKMQKKEALDYMYKQVIQKIDRKVEEDYIGKEADYQRLASDGSRDENTTEVASGAWNQLRFAKTAKEKAAAAQILIGTPLAKKAGILAIDLESRPGYVTIRYENAKLDRENIPMWNTSARDWARIGVDLHGEADAEKAMLAGGGGADTPYGALGKNPATWKNTSARREGDKKKKEEEGNKTKKDTSQYNTAD